MITPSRTFEPLGKGSQLAIKHPLASRFPLSRMCENSRAVRKREERPKRKLVTVPLVVTTPRLDWSETFPSNPATIGEGGPAAFCRVPIEKAVLAFAPDFRRLILTFHA